MVEKQKWSEIWRSYRLLRLRAPDVAIASNNPPRGHNSITGITRCHSYITQEKKICVDLYRKNASQSLHDPPEVCEGSDPLPAFSYYFAGMKNKEKVDR